MIEKLPFANPIPETKIAIDAAQSAAEAVVKIYNKDFCHRTRSEIRCGCGEQNRFRP